MIELNFTPFPVLETERLVLRRITEEDADDLFALRSNEDAMKYIAKALPKTKDDILQLMEKMNDNSMRIQWAMALKSDNRLIGSIGYHIIEKENHRAEIGYMLLPMHWKTGLMSEALSAVIDYGFNQMNLHSIEARINPENRASANILLKHGFTREGLLKESYHFNGHFYDSEIYGRVKNKN